jgi:hypothetical protein
MTMTSHEETITKSKEKKRKGNQSKWEIGQQVAKRVKRKEKSHLIYFTYLYVYLLPNSTT